jgi:chromosome segregation ATPase
MSAAFMIESIMYFGIGVLLAALFGLSVIPLIHNRAVRLTTRRLEAAMPLSMAEIQADKDLLRAEFAMSTRRLEMNVEQFKTKSARQVVELGKKDDAINRLKVELGTLRDQLPATENKLTGKATAMHAAERTLADKESELARLKSALEERSVLVDSQKVEIVALRMQTQTLKEQLTQTGEEVRAVEGRRDTEHIELKAATQKLMEERSKFENFHRRVAELVERLVVQRATSALFTGQKFTSLPH